MVRNSSHLATKIDLKKLEKKLNFRTDGLRAELKQDFHRLAVDQVKLWGKMEAMERRLSSQMEAGFSRIIGIVDACISRLEVYDRESILIPKTLDALGCQVRGHEKRIQALELSG